MQLELYPGAPVKLLHSCGMHLRSNLIPHMLPCAACPQNLRVTEQFGDIGEAHSRKQVAQESESVPRQERSQGVWAKVVIVGLVHSAVDRGMGLDI